MSIIYLDNNATTRMDDDVVAAMLPYFTEMYGNPSSTFHQFGLAAEQAVERVKRTISGYLNADSKNDIIFTSGATESNNMVLRGIIKETKIKKPHIIITSIEHASILYTCRLLEKNGVQCTYLSVNQNGKINLQELEDSIQDNTVLISIMYANNEIGVIEPIEEACKLAREHNILFHTDATQYIGAYPVDVRRLPVDMVTFTAHKIYGPKGIGILYANEKARTLLAPLITGGEQQHGMRAGTLNVASIVGMGKAIELLSRSQKEDSIRIASMRNTLADSLSAYGNIRINGDLKDRIPNNLNITLPGITAVALATKIPDIAFSTQSACSSISNNSHVLKAIGMKEDEMKCTVRLGLSKYTTEDEISRTVKAIGSVLTQAAK